jgi:hypothetical protein
MMATAAATGCQNDRRSVVIRMLQLVAPGRISNARSSRRSLRLRRWRE